jgi:hypothetical protein
MFSAASACFLPPIHTLNPAQPVNCSQLPSKRSPSSAQAWSSFFPPRSWLPSLRLLCRLPLAVLCLLAKDAGVPTQYAVDFSSAREDIARSMSARVDLAITHVFSASHRLFAREGLASNQPLCAVCRAQQAFNASLARIASTASAPLDGTIPATSAVYARVDLCVT